MKKWIAIVLTLSVWLCALAMTEICVAEAGKESADLTAHLVNAWQTGDVEYEAVAKGGGFTITGTLTQTAAFVLGADGTMSSGFSLTEFSDMGILPFEAPDLDFSAFDRYTYREGKLTLLPDGPELVCEYEESARTLTLIYTGEVTVKERQTSPGVPGSPVMPGGDCSITLKVKLTPAASDGDEAETVDAAAADIPVEMLGVWQGVGTPKNGGSSISLTVSINTDGTGEYTFYQAGYVESYPFTLTSTDSRFSVDMPAENQLGISGCEGTWALEDGVLKLDITTTFASGSSYSYTAECTKVEEEMEEDAADAVQTEVPAPTLTPAPAPGAEEEISQLKLLNAVLDALGDETYRTTYEALMADEVVERGSKGDTARGVQQTLVAFGQNISVDGSAGPKTFAALNAVQAAFGLEQTDVLGTEGYALLLPRLLLYTDSDAAYRTFYAEYDGSGEYEYMSACASALQGRYATAKKSFEDSRWGDWQARADACVQPWPKTGVLYKNPDVKGSSTELTVKFNTDPDTAMLVKIYTVDGVLARTMFIGGTGKATASLPAGTYIIKDGTGKNWYGEEESFGAEGYYEIMTFDNGEQQLQLKKNYRSTITVNVQEADPESDRVGSERESWNDF